MVYCSGVGEEGPPRAQQGCETRRREGRFFSFFCSFCACPLASGNGYNCCELIRVVAESIPRGQYDCEMRGRESFLILILFGRGEDG